MDVRRGAIPQRRSTCDPAHSDAPAVPLLHGIATARASTSARQEVGAMFDTSRRGEWDGGTSAGIDDGPVARGVEPERSRPPLPVQVASAAFYVPPRVETAAELAPRIGKSEDWIVSRTGVRERRIAAEPVEALGVRAARAALGPGPAPDLIVNASTTPRQLIPDTSVFIQEGLGLEGIPSYSVHASCLSFLVALHNAAALVTAGAYRRVLLVSAERPTPNRNLAEPESASLVGDGAAAAVLVPTPKGETSALVGWRM